MNLKHLLSIGQSFFGIRSVPNPYRMTKENLLPDFGSTFKTDSASAKTAVKVFSAEASDTFNLQHSPKPIGRPLIQSPTPKAALSPTGGEGSAGDCGSHRKPVVSSNPFAARKAKSKATRHWIQGELPISAVEVVRNDLTEDDFEIIETRTHVAPSNRAANPKGHVERSIRKWNPFAVSNIAATLEERTD